MRVKVFYKGPILWNMILFSFFSFIFIYFQSLFKFNTSILNNEFLHHFIQSNWPFMTLMCGTLICLLNDIRKLGASLFLALIGGTLAMTTYYLFSEFSKIPLILLFFYLLIGFYLLQFYNVEVNESYYNPLYDENDLFMPSRSLFHVTIYQDQEKLSDALLTNWSEDGCFLFLDNICKLKGKVSLHIEYKGHVFKEDATIVSAAKDGRGFGAKFKFKEKMKKMQHLGWNSFYEIIDEMGFEPELLK